MKIAEKSIWKYTIVYYDNACSKRCAERIRDAIVKRVGVRLPMLTDSFDERECEILVGKTCRRESVEIRDRYDRPNICYDIQVKNNKLGCMGEGYQTLDRVASVLEDIILYAQSVCLDGVIVSGDLRREPDGDMIERADGTQVRVFDWNLNAPANTGDNWQMNAERVSDVMLRHLPDVIGTNELYNSENCMPYKRFYDAVVREISDHYTVLEGSTYDEGQPLEGIVGDPNRYGTPPHHIFINKASGIKSLRSGYRYTQNLVAYHGYRWAVLEGKDNEKFIFSVGHYEDCRSNPVCAVGHMETVDFAQAQSGSDQTLPAVITGDLFTHIGCHKGGYDAFINAGYTDAQRCADLNCNGDITWSTYHHPGRYSPRWASIDLIFCNAQAHALKFKVITSQEALDVSDHCPVCADIKFN